MDKTALDNLAPEKREQLVKLQSELEGELLIPLLKRLMERFELSVNQMAISAGMDESTMHKILNGAHREFKAVAADALVDDMVTLGKLKIDDPTDQLEKSVWLRALRIASFLHFDFYKVISPRIKNIAPEAQQKALTEYLQREYPALAQTYEATGGQFPVFIPLAYIVAQQLLKRWGSVEVIEPAITISTPEPLRVETPDSLFMPTYKYGKDGKRMILIPAGEFLRGTSDADILEMNLRFGWGTSWFEYEKPQRHIYLDAYYIDEKPVTNEEYKKFLDATGHCIPEGWDESWRTFPAGKDTHPVADVTWDDANAYARWAGKRLPTEAEWEKAARGIDGRLYPWGSEQPDETRCNFTSNEQGTTPVGKYSPRGDSPYHIKDMAGNVWEWCADCLGLDYYAHSPSHNPRNDTPAEHHVLRGGACHRSAESVRAAHRDSGSLFNRDGNIGFRCAQ